MLFEIRRELANAPSDRTDKARLAFEGGVRLDKAVINRATVIVEDHVEQAEPRVDCLEQLAINTAVLRFGRFGAGRQVVHAAITHELLPSDKLAFALFCTIANDNMPYAAA